MSLTTLLIILFVFALLGGGFGQGRFGVAGWSPAGMILLVLIVLFLMGRLR
jgi:hypothetical protein